VISGLRVRWPQAAEGGENGNLDTVVVAVTTRLAGVGTLCPFASENGAVATQSIVNTELGRRGVEYLDDGSPSRTRCRRC